MLCRCMLLSDKSDISRVISNSEEYHIFCANVMSLSWKLIDLLWSLYTANYIET